MEFIKAEEFLRQPIAIRNVLLDWWKCDFGDKAEKFIGKDMEEVLDCIKRYRKHVDTYGY